MYDELIKIVNIQKNYKIQNIYSLICLLSKVLRQTIVCNFYTFLDCKRKRIEYYEQS